MSLQFEDPLYHGTVSEISLVDVTLGRGKKDFGRGFYLLPDKQQAWDMAAGRNNRHLYFFFIFATSET